MSVLVAIGLVVGVIVISFFTALFVIAVLDAVSKDPW